MLKFSVCMAKKILDKVLLMDRRQEFSLTGEPAGMYVTHVTSGENSGSGKIIKKEK